MSETDANGCFASDSLAVEILFVGIDENHENTILVFPNPASNVLNVVLPESFQDVKISLYDIAGRQIITQEHSMHKVELDLSGTTSGVYILRLQKGKTVLTHRVVIQ